MIDEELDERLTKLEELLAIFDADINRLKPMELELIRIGGLIDKIAQGLGINLND